MNKLEILKKSLVGQVGPRLSRVRDCIDNLNYDFSADKVDLAEVLMDLESIMRHVQRVQALETEYNALDAKADEIMIPQLMAPALDMSEDIDFLPSPAAPVANIVEAAGF